jgi:hypothetical protein
MRRPILSIVGVTLYPKQNPNAGEEAHSRLMGIGQSAHLAIDEASWGLFREEGSHQTLTFVAVRPGFRITI